MTLNTNFQWRRKRKEIIKITLWNFYAVFCAFFRFARFFLFLLSLPKPYKLLALQEHRCVWVLSLFFCCFSLFFLTEKVISANNNYQFKYRPKFNSKTEILFILLLWIFICKQINVKSKKMEERRTILLKIELEMWLDVFWLCVDFDGIVLCKSVFRGIGTLAQLSSSLRSS